ncbi:MAG: membrane protein insertion efficiency factor YidD [Chlamydiae bacterium RIFCSPHIGHO2_12_FULL_49_11]|nr:MAG: membrane protein insertion efficiency factor YidD [Chlamydiae bacterium RIFCSPHIGHO2_12_FULL_49_11]
MRRLLIALVRLYQKGISPFLGPCCRFYPSCSHYALSVLQKKPLWRAFGLIIKRLSKCHPFHPGGIDLPP